ncbi:15188_t:CDS:2, partial [Racocetra fulgida]
DYVIINEGVYPPLHQLAYTKKPEQYAIPDQYIVRTTYGKRKHIAEYVQLFGLQLNSVYKVRKTLLSNTYLNAQPFNNLSNSTQQLFDSVKDFKKNIIHNDDKVEIKQARFTVNNKPFEIHYRKFNQKDLEDLHLAVLKSLDKGKISHGAISNTCQRLNEQMNNLVPLSLINIEQSAILELTIDQPHITNFDIVNNIVESVGKGGHRSIIDLLNFMIPEYVKREFLIPNNTSIKLRISGDRRNVGRKVQHV